jgi:diguanylate cyclase (GGDEF)-like protein/PAS domain S-box-containing protein
MITDGDNNIVSVNAAFTRITGYEAGEVIGKNPRLLRSERHDAAFYQELWDTLNTTGHWQGEIWDKRKNGEEYPKWLAITVVLGERDIVANYIAIFADITERKEAEGKIQYLAHFDSLTGLPNRALLQDRLKQALAAASRHKKQLSLLFLDLDHFKNINDSLGHDVGDLLLQAVAERLQGCVREGDTVSRLGGDEFVVVLLDIQKSDNAAYVAQKIVDELAVPFSLGEHVLYVTSSIGISLFPEDGRNSDILIRNADSAMYSAKTGGRNDYRFFTQDMNEQALARLALEIDLRQALALGEFRLHYQPQISSETGKVIGMEALIRWQHPVRGMVSPASFIPLAEELGLIVSIGDWVLREACRQNRAWQVQGLPPVPIAVNLSALQFLQQNLPDKIHAILEETGLEPRYLELELTESTFMQDAEQTITMLQTLKAMGLQLAIDDFGTGYSSLSYLKRFPIDKLKIDQSFVRHLASDPDDAAIARTIINMGHSLRLEVIAEGVETAEQLVFLETEGCDHIQGYYFSKPLAADEFSVFCCNNMDR